jgi:hypothetical protein
VTWAEILDMIYDILCGTDAADCPWPEYPTTSISAWCDEAVRDLVAKGKILDKRNVIVAVASTGTYDLPDDCMTVWRASFDGDKLFPTSVSGIRNTNRWWTQYTGTPRFYYLDELNRQIGLYEIPATGTTAEASSGNPYGFVIGDGGGFLVDIEDATPIGPTDDGFLADVISGNDLQVFYYAYPPSLNILDAPSVPSWAQPLIVYYALKQAFSAYGPLQDHARAGFYGALYAWGRGRLCAKSNGRLAEKRWIRETTSGSSGDVLVSNRLPRAITPP